MPSNGADSLAGLHGRAQGVLRIVRVVKPFVLSLLVACTVALAGLASFVLIGPNFRTNILFGIVFFLLFGGLAVQLGYCTWCFYSERFTIMTPQAKLFESLPLLLR